MSKLNFAYWQSRHLTPQHLKTGRFEHISAGLRSISDQLKAGKKLRILDLGPPVRESVEFFSKYRCELSFVALEIERLTELSLDSQLEDFRDREYDVILGWEYLNHLSEKHRASLMHFIQAVSHSGTKALIFLSTVSYLPELPSVYRILGADLIVREVVTSQRKQVSPATTREIKQLLGGWKLEKAMQLRDHMQEQLFQKSVSSGLAQGLAIADNIRAN